MNADGVAVAASLFDAEQPLAQAGERGGRAVVRRCLRAAHRNRAISPRSARSPPMARLRRVVMAESDGTAQASSNEYLIDISRLREPVQALQVSWAAGQAPFDRPYRVTASDDLKKLAHGAGRRAPGRTAEQRCAHPQGPHRTGQRAGEIPAPGALAERPAALALASVRAEFAVGNRGGRIGNGKKSPASALSRRMARTAFVTKWSGRFPFERADVCCPATAATNGHCKSRDERGSRMAFRQRRRGWPSSWKAAAAVPRRRPCSS